MTFTPNFGYESVGNSSTDILLSGATFTGEAELDSSPDVMSSCFSDTAGTLYFDFSVNGTDWRTFPVSGFQVSAGIHEFHTAVKGPRYFRTRFINGTTGQSIFQLKTYFGQYSRLPSAPLNQSYGLDSDSIIVRQSLPWLDIARGLASGISITEKYGRNSNVGTSFEPVSMGGIYRTPQTGSATTLRVKAGGNANDTAAGTGAREITLIGLDENSLLATATLATAGASASASTTTTFTRLFRNYVSASGTYATAAVGSHSADIVIENTAGTEDWGTIDSTDFPKGQSEIGAYSAEVGETLYIKLKNITANTGKNVDVIFFERDNIDQVSAPYSPMRAKSVLVGLDGGSIHTYTNKEVPLGPFVGPCDVGFMTKVSTGTGEVSVDFDIYSIRE